VSEKRRGLGRGLGALIPSNAAPVTRPLGDRPVDVFFPGRDGDGEEVGSRSEGGHGEAPPSNLTVLPGGRLVPASTGAGSVPHRPHPVIGPGAPGGPVAPVGPVGPGVPAPSPAPSSAPSSGVAAPTALVAPGIAGPGTAAPGIAAPGVVTPGTVPPATPAPVVSPGMLLRGPGTPPQDPSEGSWTPTARPAALRAPGDAGGPEDAQGPGPALVAVAADAAPTTPEPPAAAASPSDGLVPVPGATFAELPVGSIRPNPKQPRQVFDEEELAELVHSIQEVGVLQPVVVRRVADEDGEARFELIMGERRLRATRDAGLDRIPAIVRDTQDDALLRDALLENLHRSQLNPLEEAAAYQQLLDDFGCTHEELASRIGRSRPQISNTLRLLKLPALVQRRVAAGILSAGHARALLGLEDQAGMERLAQRIVAEGLSVRAVEEIVALGDGPVAKPAKRRPRPGAHTSELNDLAARLGDRLDTRVAIALGRSKGRLSIDFASVEDLNRIIALLGPDVRGAFNS